MKGMVSPALEAAVVCSLLKRLSMDQWFSITIDQSPLQRSFLGEDCSKGMQSAAKKWDYLDTFQSGFRLGFSTETYLVTLMVLDLSVAFDSINHSVLLSQLHGLGALGAPFYSEFLPFSGVSPVDVTWW